MKKSIKEKVEEYGLQYSVIDYDADGNTYKDVDKPSMDFEEDANYVLDIVEKELPLENNRNLNDYGKALVWRLKNYIEQLKK